MESKKDGLIGLVNQGKIQNGLEMDFLLNGATGILRNSQI